MIEVVPASSVHICRIARNMRADDILECAAFGHSPKQALRAGFMHSSDVWTAKVDGVPEAMFGVVVTNALCGHGRPWMLGSDAIYRHPREMLRGGHIVLRRWLDSTPHLENLVSLGNVRAIRMLRRWGCTLDRKEVILSTCGAEFVPFRLER